MTFFFSSLAYDFHSKRMKELVHAMGRDPLDWFAFIPALMESIQGMAKDRVLPS